MCVWGGTILVTDPWKKGFSHNPVTQGEILCCIPTRVVGSGWIFYSPVLCVSIDFRNLPGQSHKELPSFFLFVCYFLSYSVWINIIIIWIEKQISIWIKFSWQQYLHTQKNKNKQNSIRPHIFSIPNRWKKTGRKLLGRSKVFVCFFCHVCSPYKTISLEGNVLLLWKTKNSLF